MEYVGFLAWSYSSIKTKNWHKYFLGKTLTRPQNRPEMRFFRYYLKSVHRKIRSFWSKSGPKCTRNKDLWKIKAWNFFDFLHDLIVAYWLKISSNDFLRKKSCTRVSRQKAISSEFFEFNDKSMHWISNFLNGVAAA